MKFTELISDKSPEIDEFQREYHLNYENDAVKSVFQKIETSCQSDAQLRDYYEKMVEGCYSYTDIVCQFHRLTQEYKSKKISEEEYRNRFESIDKTRSVVHNSTIDNFNILSRLMGDKKLSNDWIAPLSRGGRVAYGTYAIKKTLLDIFENNKNNHGE